MVKEAGHSVECCMQDYSYGNRHQDHRVNARFGDPETQVIFARLETDLLDIFLATVNGRFGGNGYSVE